MTTLDPALYVRGKIIAALKSDTGLTEIVPAARIYPAKTPASPAFPFIRVPMLLTSAVPLDGGDGGSDNSGPVHCFTKGSDSNKDPEAQAAIINRHVARVLSRIDRIELSDGELLAIHVDQMQVIPDSVEADAYHGIVSVRSFAS